MICIKCKREIKRSYGAPHLMGNYCAHCATLLGLTEDQIKNSSKVIIHCDVTQTFLNEYKAEIEKATAKEITDILEHFNKHGDNDYAIRLVKTRFDIT